MSQSHGATIVREPANSGATTTPVLGLIVAVDAHTYTLSRTGTPVASLVSDGYGGYVLTPGDLTGTGKGVFVGDNVIVI